MVESDQTLLLGLGHQNHHHKFSDRRTIRPHSLIPDPDVPPLAVRWFHAIDNPIVDPISLRRAKSTSSKKPPISPSPLPKKSAAKNWIPFSKRDSNALEKAFQGNDVRAMVPVNEDHLFEVDVYQRTISPIYWEGPTYEVRRATWFIQSDGSKWTPCEENLAEQIELGYYKYKPYLLDITEANSPNVSSGSPKSEDGDKDVLEAAITSEEKKLELSLESQPVEKQWNLLGPYLGQYIVYTGVNTAWLLYNTTGSKIAKSIITRLTNKANLGGTRLIRGFPEVEKQNKSKTAAVPKTQEKHLDSTKDRDILQNKNDSDSAEKEEQLAMEQESEDYNNEASEEEVRPIDHLVFVIHGIGQKMSERLGQNFVHDVNMLRKTLKSTYSTAIAATATPDRPNGIQVLPVLWRHEIKFGMASEHEEGAEMDLGTVGADDGCPTLDELTLDGVPNIRLVVSDVLLDVPLYLTQRYRDQMTYIITKEINRVYRIFARRNPDFIARNGKVTFIGHSLGSLLAFDILSVQPVELRSEKRNLALLNEDAVPLAMDKKTPALIFPVQNFFAVGSPLGVILLLRGYKIAPRSLLDHTQPGSGPATFGDLSASPSSSSSVGYCYPAVANLYNVFHKSDPVAYRLEPLIARNYSGKLKPVQIAYIKGGLKSVIDAGFSVGSGIANRAGAMYESFKVGLTTNLFMRGFGISKQQQESTTERNINEGSELSSTHQLPPPHPQHQPHSMTLSQLPTKSVSQEQRLQSKSDPALADKFRSGQRKSTISPNPQQQQDNLGAEKLRMLNVTGRVDFCLQEGILENPYLSAFSAHMQYWQDLDVAAFLIREIYRDSSTATTCT